MRIIVALALAGLIAGCHASNCGGDPCCGDPCCGDPCCGDPCCGDPCCGDSCCGDPCCGDPNCSSLTETGHRAPPTSNLPPAPDAELPLDGGAP